MRLDVSNLRSGYGRVEVLHGLSFSVDSGTAVGLFGPNGHGKTTLLRTISGLVPATTGKIVFDGKDIAGANAEAVVDCGIVHVAQASTLFPRMTVLEALTLGAYRKAAWPHRRTSLKKVFSIFPRLAERRSQHCRTLSGGERQMAAIGVGLMGMPRLLMLDEPTLGLAPVVIDKVAEVLVSLRGRGLAILLAEQNLRMALGIADRGYVMETGTVVQEGRAADLMNDPKVVSAYLGAA